MYTHPQGVGAELRGLGLGGHHLPRVCGKPLLLGRGQGEWQARVLKVTDGEYTLSGPMMTNLSVSQGPAALIDVDGVEVIRVCKSQSCMVWRCARDTS